MWQSPPNLIAITSTPPVQQGALLKVLDPIQLQPLHRRPQLGKTETRQFPGGFLVFGVWVCVLVASAKELASRKPRLCRHKGEEMSASNDDAKAMELQSSVHYSVARVCQEECIRMQTSISKEATAALGDLVWRYLTGKCCKKVSVDRPLRAKVASNGLCRADTVVPDIKAFRDHAKRSTVTADDVKLLARRDATVKAQLEELEAALASAKQAKKRARSES